MIFRFCLVLTALSLITTLPTQSRAQTEQCSLTLTAVNRERQPEVFAAALRSCDLHWEGRLPGTGARAEVKVETNQDVPDGLMDALVSALRRADLESENLPRIQGPESVQLLVYGPGAVPTRVRETATASTYTSGPDCHILYLHDTWSNPERRAYLAYTIAHEFFHCLQGATVPDLLWQGPEWAIEGSAVLVRSLRSAQRAACLGRCIRRYRLSTPYLRK